MKEKSVLKEHFETVSPVSIDPSFTSIKVGISRRFLLFRFLSWLTRKIEDDPHLNFISVLKSYKALGNILDGTLHELYRDRNSLYFKNFFVDEKLYRDVKNDLVWVYKRSRALKEKIHITITKRGVIVYENYRENKFNVLLMTVHSGKWMHQDLQKKQAISKHDRLLEEDVDTHKLYADLVLKKGGIWIDNKASRFECDYNRSEERAIYKNGSEEWIDILWKEPLSKEQVAWLLQGYKEFYHTLSSIVRAYHFNIIFDAHSMKDGPGRAEISFGTVPIPKFYMPIVHSMREKLKKLGYKDVAFNKPFPGGYLLHWMSERFPDRFIFSAEINKKLYMTKDRTKVIPAKCEKFAKNILEIFDIEN